MNLVSRDPWNDFTNLRREMDRLFNSPRGGELAEDGSSIATSVWSPAVDIKEEEGKFTLVADVPGVDPKDIEITMADGRLTIRGERKHEAQSEQAGFKRIERSYGSFYRRFALPDTAAEEQVDASYDNGVLTVTIPKQERARPRQVEVRTN